MINYWAVLASAVVSVIVGSIWYGPLFGKMFTREMGMDQWTPEKQAAMKKTMSMSYALQFIASLVMFYVLGHFISRNGDPLNFTGWQTGLHVALWIWIGFVVPLALGNAIWGGKYKLFWLNIGNMLITLLITGAIIGAWR